MMKGRCCLRLLVSSDLDNSLSSQACDAVFIGDVSLTALTFSLNHEMRSLACSLRRSRPQMGPGGPRSPHSPPRRRLISDPSRTASVFTLARRVWFQPVLALITEGFLYRMVITKDKYARSKRLPERSNSGCLGASAWRLARLAALPPNQNTEINSQTAAG